MLLKLPSQNQISTQMKSCSHLRAEALCHPAVTCGQKPRPLARRPKERAGWAEKAPLFTSSGEPPPPSHPAHAFCELPRPFGSRKTWETLRGRRRPAVALRRPALPCATLSLHGGPSVAEEDRVLRGAKGPSSPRRGGNPPPPRRRPARGSRRQGTGHVGRRWSPPSEERSRRRGRVDCDCAQPCTPGQTQSGPPTSDQSAPRLSWEQQLDKDANMSKEENVNQYFAQFLEVFPAQREEIEKCLRCLREIADEIDKVHKDCTIANVTARSTGAVSGILSILGLSLAPVTAGVSLILTATGIGLGAAAATTGISASLCEHFINSKKGEKAQELMNQCKRSLRMVTDQIDFDSGLLQPNDKTVQEILQRQKIPDVISTVKEITVNVKALKHIEANPLLKDLAKKAAGSQARASTKRVKEVKKAFQGTALAMSKEARVMSALAIGLSLLTDAASIIQDAIHLAQGATVEAAGTIRAKANELEKIVQDLSNLYKELNEVDE
ncbi:apolipoprotein L6-like [Elgaria multicarinata webbii]|uniref:apolipoprotein L6-like n=1 Tax=Elgaria multicarinata webbii TaxID=159646 RepID=UPI002FCD5188